MLGEGRVARTWGSGRYSSVSGASFDAPRSDVSPNLEEWAGPGRQGGGRGRMG